MVTYLHHLNVPSSSSPSFFTQSDPQFQDLTPVPLQRLLEQTSDSLSGRPTSAGADTGGFDAKPVLLLAGYSYGSLITINLEPSLLSILVPFQRPVSGSPYADIRSRARFLATQQNEAIEATYSILRARSHRRGRSLQSGEQILNSGTRISSSGVRMGGDEDIRRTSHDIHGSGRRSFSVDAPLKVRKSLDRVKFIVQHGSPKRGQSYTSKMNQGQASDANVKTSDKHSQGKTTNTADSLGNDIKVAYLLVSPLPPEGMINNLASIGSLRPSSFFGKQSHKMENETKFTIDPTLVVYGTGDLFVHVKTFERK